MGGEHLAIANFDNLSEEELAAKIDQLSNNPNAAVDWTAMLEYEKSKDEPRGAVVSQLEGLTGTSVEAGSQTPATPDTSVSDMGKNPQ